MNKYLAKIIMSGLAFAICLGLASPANAAYQIGEGDRYLKLGGLLQFHADITPDGAPNETSVGTNMYVRRMRLMVFGQINKWVNFFIETDNPRLGMDNDAAGKNYGSTFIQDAYVELNLHPAFQIDVGMLLTPFSHHGMQGATSLLSLDYHPVIKYPAGSSLVWRDFGIMFRGLPIKWLEYRLAITNGVHGMPEDDDDNFTDPRNEKDIPRLTARLTFNVFEPEGGPGAGGMFYDGLYIKDTENGIVSTKKVLSIGASFDFQPGVNVPSDLSNDTDPQAFPEDATPYIGVAGDVFWDIPLDAAKLMSLNGQVNAYYYNHGDYAADRPPISGQRTGVGLMSEVGFRYNAIQPLVIFDMFQPTSNPDDVDAGKYMGIYGGVNYYLFAHALTLKGQFGASQSDGADDWDMAAKLQLQLVF